MYRIDKLLKANQKLFHTKDIYLLWGITNKNTLYTTIKEGTDNTAVGKNSFDLRTSPLLLTYSSKGWVLVKSRDNL